MTTPPHRLAGLNPVSGGYPRHLPWRVWLATCVVWCVVMTGSALARDLWVAEPIDFSRHKTYTDVKLVLTSLSTKKTSAYPATLLTQRDDFWVFGKINIERSGHYHVDLTYSEGGEAKVHRLVTNRRYDFDAVDVALVLDKSKSMDENDPNNLRYESLKQFIFLAQNSTRIGNISIVTFNQEASVPYPMAPPNNIKDITPFKQALKPAGNTNYTDALGVTLRILNRSKDSDRVVLFLSDGEPNDRYQNIHRDFAPLNTTIYSIGLSAEADKKLLKRIAEESHGAFFDAPTAEDLSGIFSKIFRMIDRPKPIFKQVMRVSKRRRLPFVIDGSMRNIFLRVVPISGNVTVALDEKIVHRGTKQDFSEIPLENLKFGQHSLTTVGQGKVSLEIVASTNLALHPMPFNTQGPRGLPVRLDFFLEGYRFCTDITATGAVTMPNGKTQVVSITYDEGKKLYRAQWPQTDGNGAYRLRVRINGKVQGKPFVRETVINYERSGAALAKITSLDRAEDDAAKIRQLSTPQQHITLESEGIIRHQRQLKSTYWANSKPKTFTKLFPGIAETQTFRAQLFTRNSLKLNASLKTESHDDIHYALEGTLVPGQPSALTVTVTPGPTSSGKTLHNEIILKAGTETWTIPIEGVVNTPKIALTPPKITLNNTDKEVIAQSTGSITLTPQGNVPLTIETTLSALSITPSAFEAGDEPVEVNMVLRVAKPVNPADLKGTVTISGPGLEALSFPYEINFTQAPKKWSIFDHMWLLWTVLILLIAAIIIAARKSGRKTVFALASVAAHVLLLIFIAPSIKKDEEKKRVTTMVVKTFMVEQQQQITSEQIAVTPDNSQPQQDSAQKETAEVQTKADAQSKALDAEKVKIDKPEAELVEEKKPVEREKTEQTDMASKTEDIQKKQAEAVELQSEAQQVEAERVEQQVETQEVQAAETMEVAEKERVQEQVEVAQMEVEVQREQQQTQNMQSQIQEVSKKRQETVQEQQQANQQTVAKVETQQATQEVQAKAVAVEHQRRSHAAHGNLKAVESSVTRQQAATETFKAKTESVAKKSQTQTQETKQAQTLSTVTKVTSTQPTKAQPTSSQALAVQSVKQTPTLTQTIQRTPPTTVQRQTTQAVAVTTPTSSSTPVKKRKAETSTTSSAQAQTTQTTQGSPAKASQSLAKSAPSQSSRAVSVARATPTVSAPTSAINSMSMPVKRSAPAQTAMATFSSPTATPSKTPAKKASKGAPSATASPQAVSSSQSSRASTTAATTGVPSSASRQLAVASPTSSSAPSLTASQPSSMSFNQSRKSFAPPTMVGDISSASSASAKASKSPAKRAASGASGGSAPSAQAASASGASRASSSASAAGPSSSSTRQLSVASAGRPGAPSPTLAAAAPSSLFSRKPSFPSSLGGTPDFSSTSSASGAANKSSKDSKATDGKDGAGESDKTGDASDTPANAVGSTSGGSGKAKASAAMGAGAASPTGGGRQLALATSSLRPGGPTSALSKAPSTLSAGLPGFSTLADFSATGTGKGKDASADGKSDGKGNKNGEAGEGDGAALQAGTASGAGQGKVSSGEGMTAGTATQGKAIELASVSAGMPAGLRPTSLPSALPSMLKSGPGMSSALGDFDSPTLNKSAGQKDDKIKDGKSTKKEEKELTGEFDVNKLVKDALAGKGGAQIKRASDSKVMNASGSDKIEDNVEYVISYHYNNGQLKAEIPFINGKPHGIIKAFMSSGTLSQTRQFKAGQRDGLSKFFYPTGELSHLEVFKGGAHTGDKWAFYESGNISYGSPQALGKSIVSRNARMRSSSAKVLAKMGKRAEGARAGVLKALATDKDATVRLYSVKTLGNLAPSGGKATLKALTQALQDKDPGVKKAACEALARFGPAAKSAVGTLRKLAKAGYAPAIKALAKIDIKG